jgi:hypothetical protein
MVDHKARECTHAGCINPCRGPKQRYCKKCHAEAMKATRAKQRVRWRELENLSRSTSPVSRETQRSAL